MKKKLIVFLMVLMMISLLAGCHRSETGVSEEHVCEGDCDLPPQDGKGQEEPDIKPEEMQIGETIFAPSTNRKVYVNSDVDVDIYYNDGTLLAQVIDGEESEIENGPFLYSFVYNGQRIFIIPNDCECEIIIRPKEDALFTYTCIEQYYADSRPKRIISYTEKQVKQGDILIGHIKDVSDGLTIDNFALEKNGEYLSPDIELDEDEIVYYNISVKNEGDGYTLGYGYYTKGEYVSLTIATSFDNFLGWYEDGTLISAEQEYRFLAEKDRSITARFDTFTYGTSLSFDEDEVSIKKGETVKLKVNLLPETADLSNLFFLTENPDTISVDEKGYVTGLKTGSAIVKVFTMYGTELSATCTVNVSS